MMTGGTRLISTYPDSRDGRIQANVHSGASDAIANVSHHVWTILAASYTGRSPSLIVDQLLVGHAAVAGVAIEEAERRDRRR